MYQRNRRRVLAGASALAVAATLALAACSSDEPADNLADKRVGAMANYGVGVDFKATEPLTFSILINNHPNYPLDTSWKFWEWLEEQTNVKFEFVDAPLSDFNTRRTTLINAGEAPQIISRFYGNQENEFIASGALLPVSQYVEAGLLPNFKARYDEWGMKSDLDTHIQDDGNYYVLPGMHEQKRLEYSFAVRQDVLDALNIDTPRTIDDFYDMLKAIKTAYPDKYPLSDRFNFAPADRPGGNLIRTIAAAYGVRAGWDYDTVSWNYDQNKYELTATSDGYKKALEFLNKLIREGLLDPESFTQQDDQALQKLARGDSFVISSNTQNIVDYRKNVAEIPGAEFSLIPVPTGPFGERVFGGRLENGIALRSDVKDDSHFVALLQFVDWLFYSENGQLLAKFGKEGETYTMKNGVPTINSDITMASFNPGAEKHLQKDFGVWNGAFVYGGTVELMQAGYTPEEKAFYDAQLEGREVLPLAPPAPFDELENEEATIIRAPLTTHVMTESLKFILGQRSFDTWNAFVSEVEGQEGPRYLELVNAAQARFAAANG